MLDLEDRKLRRLRQTLQGLLYFGDSSTSKEKHNQQREEDAPRMYSVNNCCQCCDNDAEGCQGLSRIRPVDKGNSGGDGDVGTARFGVRFSFCGIYRVSNFLQRVMQIQKRYELCDITGGK